MKKIIRLLFFAAAIGGLSCLLYRNRATIRGLLRNLWTKSCIRRSECEEFEDL